MRPDIAHAVNDLARVAHNPGRQHLHAISHVSRYLASTRDLALIYRRPEKPTAPVVWTDSNYAPNYGTAFDNYRSTSAYVVTSNGSALSWRSRRQPRLATSSCEAETVAACAAAKEAVLSRKWQQATTGVAPRTLLLGDNASSIKAETNGSDNDGSKHVDVAAHYVRERMRSGDISYHYVSTTENIADCLSKNNYYPAFKKFRAAMGVA